MKREEIKVAIENMTTTELIELNNRYCQEFGFIDDEIFENDEEFFELFFNGKPAEAVRASFYGDYRYADDYVRFNGYGNLESLNSFTSDDLPDFLDTVCDNIKERFNEFEDLF